ncbi:MAG: site-2 protease family protein [Alphaproteobacteria bacterium]|nr:site-2 protease family protein [Alphaproteobacteria bacterium]
MILQILISIATIIIAIISHEIAHGWVAWYLGDDTPKKQNRLSFNPIHHIDLFGSIILPVLMFFSKSGVVFGWAKPVMINYDNLRNKKRDYILVASAGVIANFILALLSALLLKISLMIPSNLISGILAMFFLNMIFFNILLGVFNLIPIPPLDGSKILLGWSDNIYVKRYLNSDRIGTLFLIITLFILPVIIKYAGGNFNPITSFLQKTTKVIVTALI